MTNSYTKTKTGNLSWIARGVGLTGSIEVDADAESPVDVHLPITASLSKIGFGGGGKGLYRVKDDSGEVSVETLFLLALWVREEECTIKELILEAIKEHPNYKGEAINTTEELDALANEWLLSEIYSKGSAALKSAASIIEKLERSDDHAGEEGRDIAELDFMDAVKIATMETWEVPTKHDVWNLWIQRSSVREDQRKQFAYVMRKLGFGWLPSNTRGTNAHSK